MCLVIYMEIDGFAVSKVNLSVFVQVEEARERGIEPEFKSDIKVQDFHSDNKMLKISIFCGDICQAT